MKKNLSYVVLILVVLSLASIAVLAQDAEPTPGLPPSMDTAMVPCGEDVTGPCDLIATAPEDIVGVWMQYMGNPNFNAPNGLAYIRYNADGTYVMADTIENTAQPHPPFPSGTFRFEDAVLILAAPPNVPPPCNVDPHFQLRVLKYGDAPVALNYVPIGDECVGRLQDLSQALIWVAP